MSGWGCLIYILFLALMGAMYVAGNSGGTIY